MSKPKFVELKSGNTLRDFLKKSSRQGSIVETGVMLDPKRRLVGFLNYADALRAIASGKSLDVPIGSLMHKNPVIGKIGWDAGKLAAEVAKQCRRKFPGRGKVVRHLPVLDEQGKFKTVSDLLEIMYHKVHKSGRVEVYGLGFVGLTLAAVLAARRHVVFGVDPDSRVIAHARAAQPLIHEPRLSGLIKEGILGKRLFFGKHPPQTVSRTFVITVGTDLGPQKKPKLNSLFQVLRVVGPRLQRGSLVILRSTLPVGTTRNRVRPFLERISGLCAGLDFSLVYAPERTVEGVAVKELLSLPQIIGGLTDHCVLEGSHFWQSVTPSVITTESLEAAELIKLMNNSFRDLSFSFANSLSSLGFRHRVDIHKAILAANEGYPRNPIPVPGPGVGGYCLTKDPHFLMMDASAQARALLQTSRKINDGAAFIPIKIFKTFMCQNQRNLKNGKVLIMGLSFKGWPETNDLRNSISLKVAARLKSLGCRVYGFDAVLKPNQIRRAGLTPDPLLRCLGKVDAILILNNHPQNTPDELTSLPRVKPTLIFDGWSLLDKSEIEKIPNLIYANMGWGIS